MSFRNWCQSQLKAVSFDRSYPVETVLKQIMKALTRTANCAQLLKDLVESHAKLEIRVKMQQKDDEAWLKRKIFRLLRKVIKREYQIYKNAKQMHDFGLISDDSSESNTKSHTRMVTFSSSSEAIPATACFGHMVLGDKIAEVAEVYANEGGEHAALLEWRPRKNGITPESSILQLRDLLYFKPFILQDSKIFKSEVIRQKMKQLVEDASSNSS